MRVINIFRSTLIKTNIFKQQSWNKILLKAYFVLWGVFCWAYLVRKFDITIVKDFWILLLINVPFIISYHALHYLNDKNHFKRVLHKERLVWNLAGLLVVGYYVYQLI